MAIAGLDIVALTSLNEGTPVSLIEAQAGGKPIVTTNVGGVEDVVIEGKTALLAENGNVNDFTEKLLLLVEDEKLRVEMSCHGWNQVREKFHFQALVSSMRNLYNELLNSEIK